MPITWEQHEKKLDDPALCELLPVRDYLDNVLVRTSGALVAGYELRGITSYFASDQERDRSKAMLGALLKSIPEQSMRVQVRYEVVEDVAYTQSAMAELIRVRSIDLANSGAQLKFGATDVNNLRNNTSQTLQRGSQ